MKWNEMKWNEMKWNEMKWNEIKWYEIKWNKIFLLLQMMLTLENSFDIYFDDEDILKMWVKWLCANF